MILVDDRPGAVELQPLIEAAHVKTQLRRLDFADFCFEGNGPRGLAMIGIERKRLRDAISSMRTGRFQGHQLLGMLKNYDYSYLYVEGIFHANPQTGILEEACPGAWRPVMLGRQGFTFRELDNWLTSLERKAGLVVRRTDIDRDTAISVVNLWHWWNDKEWAEHRGHLALNVAAESGWVVKPGLARRVAAQLPGIGWEKSGAVIGRFRSVQDMANADERQWTEVPGVGKTLSARFVRLMRGLEDDDG